MASCSYSKTEKCVVFAYGSGGHKAQMARIFALIEPDLSDFTIITVSDDPNPFSWSNKHYVIPEARSKHSRNYLNSINSLFKFFFLALRLRISYDLRCFVSTGPGVAVILAVLLKTLSSVCIIHIETWSRFYSSSITGKIMYKVADYFYYQNKELVKIYPKAEYSGRL